MEASLERVGREIGDSYPSLCANIHMANLEIRAGRTMTDALEHLGDRLGLEEARSFSTLIQQSAELGSSITDALRVYSDDMRHRRLSRAEEKAYSLPAKLAIPMMVCIFPVLFVVILLPVVVRLHTGHYRGRGFPKILIALESCLPDAPAVFPPAGGFLNHHPLALAPDRLL